jgi:zinc transport system substrate-binding protein
MQRNASRAPGVAVSLCLTGLTAIAAPPSRSQDATALTVAVSIAPQAWIVGELGGDRVRVVTLVGSGESPHSYQPTDRQVSEVMRCDLYFRIGIPLEEGIWFRAIEKADRIAIVDLRDGIKLRDMHAHCTHGHHHHQHASGQDPHIWLSPTLLKTQARTVAKALSKADPANDDHYQANLERLLAKLDALDQDIRTLLGPHAGKAFFVFHPAWGYFCDEYGLRQVAVEIDGKEPTDSELTELQRQARREGARVVFVQPQITGRAAKAVADSISGRIEIADPLERDVAANLEEMARTIAGSYEP